MELEKSGKGENLPALRADKGQVDEGSRVAGDRTATLQFLYGLEANTSPQRTHPTVSMSHGPGII